jgi:hypothetical protein
MGPRIENKMIIWTKEEKASGASLVTKLINECEDMSNLSQILHAANELACQRNALIIALSGARAFYTKKQRDFAARMISRINGGKKPPITRNDFEDESRN